MLSTISYILFSAATSYISGAQGSHFSPFFREVPGGAADGYVFSWEGVATKAAITRRLSRSYHHLDPEVVPPRSSEASSLSVVSTLPFG